MDPHLLHNLPFWRKALPLPLSHYSCTWCSKQADPPCPDRLWLCWFVTCLVPPPKVSQLPQVTSAIPLPVFIYSLSSLPSCSVSLRKGEGWGHGSFLPAQPSPRGMAGKTWFASAQNRCYLMQDLRNFLLFGSLHKPSHGSQRPQKS